MEAQHMTDDQSHYEISLTASQAFLAFVLLLLSLGASFAFGLMIGRGQADERLVVRREPAVVTEGSVVASAKKPTGRIVELGVENTDFQANETAPVTDSAVAPMLVEESTPSTEAPAPVTDTLSPVVTEAAPAPKPVAARVEPAAAKPQSAVAPPAVAKGAPVYAQLLGTSDQKRAEAMAAKLIDGGFTTAFVERASNDKGPVYKVRVRFNNEADARAAEAKLKTYSADVWIDRN
jgi:hypothetical protein